MLRSDCRGGQASIQRGQNERPVSFGDWFANRGPPIHRQPAAAFSLTATSTVAIWNVRFTSIRDIESVATTFRIGSTATQSFFKPATSPRRASREIAAGVEFTKRQAARRPDEVKRRPSVPRPRVLEPFYR
jgi:hypothetical protein